ncbi:MAG TPA: SDR family NAD(P)-dependent oxidoreductase, partial [Spirochaetia bacterium]
MKDVVLESRPILDRFKLDGKVALVTGGGQGIGRAYCHALAEAGARVAVVDKSGELAEKVAGELATKKASSMAVTADVTDPAQRRTMVESIVAKWGRLDIGVNNAGIGDWCDAEKVSVENWRKIMGLNLDAVFFCAQEEARVMMKAGYGKIVNTASMSGHIANTPQNQVA